MSKRHNENGQMRREEVEALEDNDEDENALDKAFEKASQDVLSTRKIVKAKRKLPTESRSDDDKKSFNPFASLLSKPLTDVASSISVSATVNPFLSNFTATSSKSAFSSALGDRETIAASRSSSSYESEMKTLNASFISWLDQQMIHHPFSMWNEGVKDYIAHANKISEKYGNNDSLDQTISSDSSSFKPPQTNAFSSSAKSFEAVKFDLKPDNIGLVKPVETSNESLNDKSTNGNSSSSWLTFPPSKSFPADKTTPISNNATSSTVPPVFQFGAGSNSTGITDKPSSNEPRLEDKPQFSLAPFKFPSSATDESKDAIPKVTGMFGLSSDTNATSSLGGFGGSFGGFGGSFGGFGSSLVSGGISTKTAADGDDDGDDEGEPILEPEKVLRNEQDTDEILYEKDSKLMRYDKGSSEWKDNGKGTFRITRNPDTKKPRMLMRNQTGKIMLNSSFHNGIKFEKIKNGVKFSCLVVNDQGQTEMNMYIVKMKDADVPAAIDKLNSSVESSTALAH